MEQSFKELTFLDILIKNKNNQIITDICHKPTDTQPYLHFKSHYLQNCIKSILNTLAHRICTIVINKNRRKTYQEELNVTLYHRGHPTTLTNKGFELAEKYL